MRKYIELLDNANLFGWKIREIKKKTTELYYILDKLVFNRLCRNHQSLYK